MNMQSTCMRSFSSLTTVSYILPAVILATLLLFTVAAPGFAEENCAELVTTRCEVCHYSTRICQKVKRNKSKSSWKRTVRNMVNQGAKLDKRERKNLVTCLSKPTPEIQELCGLNK